MNRKEMLARLKKGEDPLELSIEKWQDIANGKDMEYFRAGNCALCEVHFGTCVGCVVTEADHRGCYDTPFDDYHTEWCGKKEKKFLKKIASKEVEFLKSLRKEKET